MSSSPNPWAEYKEAVLDAVGDFSRYYADLKGQKPSTNGHILALCPFHEDHSPSFTFEQATGNWRCHAGCGEGSVFDFLARRSGRSFKEEMLAVGDEHGVPRPGGGPEAETVYSYRGSGGELLYQVVRKPGKKWAQRQPDGNGGWTWSLKGVTPVLYRLPELVARADETVYVVEGEKDANRVAGLGLLATTNSGGAGKWRPSYSESLAGREVVILPDNDAAGRSHAQKIAETLIGRAASVRIVDLPDLPAKGDVSDWLDAGGTRAELEALAAAVEPRGTSEADRPAGSLPVIETTDRPLRDLLDDAWAAVLAANDPPQVFRAPGGVARLQHSSQGPVIELLEERAAMSLLAQVADWTKTTSRGPAHTKPVKEAVGHILVNPHPQLPELDTVISTPVFDHDWRLITQPGYHPQAKVWFHVAAGVSPVAVTHRPTDVEVRNALSLLLDDLLVDFPFAADSDRAHALAALLLPFIRRMVSGPTPIHMIEAPTPGSGKSLLADLITMIAIGYAAGATTLTSNEEENRKKLTALMSRGSPVISIDNLSGGMWSAQVAAAVTADVWQDRILGKTQMVSFPNRALWLMSANNPKFSMEIARRCVRIRIDPGDERPWQRTGFKHDPIREWTQQNRQQLVHAILTLVQHWIMSGAPLSSQTMGSFESWSRVVGGMIQHFGLPGFLGDLDEFYEAADAESGEWRAFVAAWWDAYRDAPRTASELLQLARDRDLVGFAYAAKNDRAERVRFGKSLGSIRDRRFGAYRVIAAKDSHSKSQVFRLIAVEREA